jgi:hypothetical protein
MAACLFCSSAAAPVLGELSVLPFPGCHAARAGIRGLVGLRQIHPHQAGPIYGRLGRLKQPRDLGRDNA